jgi:hypothetical protein
VVVVIVGMGTGGADPVHITVDGDQNPIPQAEQDQADSPAGPVRQLGQKPEYRDSQQDSSAERKEDTRRVLSLAATGCEPDPRGCCKTAHERGYRRYG